MSAWYAEIVSLILRKWKFQVTLRALARLKPTAGDTSMFYPRVPLDLRVGGVIDLVASSNGKPLSLTTFGVAIVRRLAYNLAWDLEKRSVTSWKHSKTGG